MPLAETRNGKGRSRPTIGLERRRKKRQRFCPFTVIMEPRGRARVGYRAPRGFYGSLFKYARRLIRAGDERPKPNGERFPEFRDSE